MKEIRGIGLGLRRAFADELLRRHDSGALDGRIDWLEVTPENWMFAGGAKRRLLARAAERFAVVPHSVSLNVGGLDPLDETLLGATAALVRELDAPFFSDHVCFSSVRGRPLHDLLPLPRTREAAEHAGARAREAAGRVGRPLVLENATFYATMPGGELDEADFLSLVLEQGGCELLLDVNNVYVNAQNHGFDPYAFLERLPMDRVRYLHIAGHTRQEDVIIDTHIGPVADEVWALYRAALSAAGRLVPTLLEWDQDIPALDQVLAELDRARAEARSALGSAQEGA